MACYSLGSIQGHFRGQTIHNQLLSVITISELMNHERLVKYKRSRQRIAEVEKKSASMIWSHTKPFQVGQPFDMYSCILVQIISIQIVSIQKKNSNLNQQQQQQMPQPDNQISSDQSKQPAKQHPTTKLLQQYHKKLSSQQQSCSQRLSSLKHHILEMFQKQLQLEFSIFETQFHKQKHNLSTQVKTIEYYLQNFIQKHSTNPRQNNMYPLFNEIDQKLQQNHSYIQNNFKFQFTYPQSKQQVNHKLTTIKAQIMQKQLEEIRLFLTNNQNIRKYCNKELQQIKQIHQGYGQIYAINQKKYFTPELAFVGSYEQVLLTINISQNIEKLNIGIRNNSGKMSIDQLKALLNALLKSRNLLTHVNIKIMDMEFQQQKCNLVKLFVKQLKVIKNFKLQNYYKENKLGMFQDFNWYPLKKQTHIIGKVW